MSDFEAGIGEDQAQTAIRDNPEAIALRNKLKEMVLAPAVVDDEEIDEPYHYSPEPEIGDDDSEPADEWAKGEPEVRDASAILRSYILENRDRELHDAIPQDVSEAIAKIAKQWRIANKRYLEIFHDPNSVDNWYFEEEVWYSRSMSMNGLMDPLLEPAKLLRYRSLAPEDGAVDHIVEMVSQLLDEPGFIEKAAITDFVTYDLWLAHRLRYQSSTGLAGKEAPFAKESAARYEVIKARDLPLIHKGIRKLLEHGDSDSIREVLENIAYVEESTFASEILFDLDMDIDQRQAYMIQHINVFGFIHTVDVLSHKIAQLESEEDHEASQLVLQLKQLYSLIQGEQVEGVLDQLEAVYDAVDFESYALNHQELTEKEADKLEAMAVLMGNKLGIDPHNVRILDIGAGVGRHAIGLGKRGYRHISALESQPQHRELIQAKAPGVKLVGDNWHEVPLESGFMNPDAPELFYCLGRTLPHNRTPQDMLRLFDEIHRVTAPEAMGLVDIPDISIGEYQQRVEGFGRNLETLPGIDPHVSNLIFDGPDDTHKFNRMVLTPDQIGLFAKLCGFKIRPAGSETVDSESGVDNNYFILEKDEDFDPEHFSRNDLGTMLKEVGLYDSGVDYQLYVDAWGMTLGQALLYGLDNQEVRSRNLSGRHPTVTVEKRGKTLYFEGAM